MHIQGAPIAVSRARYTEDALTNAIDDGIQQYVIHDEQELVAALKAGDFEAVNLKHAATQS